MKSTGFISLFLFILQISFAGQYSGLWKPADPLADPLNTRLEETLRNDDDLTRSSSLIHRLYRFAREKKDTLLLSRALYWESCIRLKTDKDSAAFFIENALACNDSLNYSYDRARMMFNYGAVLINRGDYLQAYRIYKKLETYFKSAGDDLFAGKTCINIGYIMDGLQEYSELLNYLQRADEYLKKGKYIAQATKNRLNIANILFQQGETEEARAMLHSLLHNEIARTDSLFLVSVYIALNNTSSTIEEKRTYLRQAYEIARRLYNENAIMYTLINIGSQLLTEEKYDSALHCYREARRYSLKNNDAYSINHILLGLSQSYEMTNRYDSACYYLKAYIQCRDSLSGNDKIIEINKIEGQYAIRKYEAEAKQAEEKARWHKKTALLIVVSITLLAGLTCYIFWLLRKKERTKKLLKEAENRELNEHLKSETLQNERFQMQIDFKNRELTSSTLAITEKNRTLKTLLHQIQDLGKEGILPFKYENELKKQIGSHITNEDEWQYFKMHFETVHPAFFNRLKEKFPSISENELHLCAYIRIGMSTKQMAQMLSVLPETINMARYRMRKKMGLTQNDSLENFLRTF